VREREMVTNQKNFSIILILHENLAIWVFRSVHQMNETAADSGQLLTKKK
jgi:hypothetical protein